MATTKTLTPTNQTITIAAFSGEKPDQRQIADAETKMADAINALNSQLVVTTPTGGEYGSVVDSSYNNRLYVKKMGHLVVVSGEFKALNNISGAAVVIATGLPASIGDGYGQFIASLGTAGNAVQLTISNTGELKTFYTASIPAGTVVRYSTQYLTP